jgi:hypothetical protein
MGRARTYALAITVFSACFAAGFVAARRAALRAPRHPAAEADSVTALRLQAMREARKAGKTEYEFKTGFNPASGR